MIEDKLYTLKELAELTKLTDRTLRNYLANGTLKGHKIGGQWRFNKEEVKALFSSSTFYIERKEIANTSVNDYINNKYTFNSNITACIIIDVSNTIKEKRCAFYKKLNALSKNDDVKEQVSFIDENGHIRMNIVGSLDYIKDVITLFDEFKEE